jgi:hypothetical protein
MEKGPARAEPAARKNRNRETRRPTPNDRQQITWQHDGDLANVTVKELSEYAAKTEPEFQPKKLQEGTKTAAPPPIRVMPRGKWDDQGWVLNAADLCRNSSGPSDNRLTSDECFFNFSGAVRFTLSRLTVSSTTGKAATHFFAKQRQIDSGKSYSRRSLPNEQ